MRTLITTTMLGLGAAAMLLAAATDAFAQDEGEGRRGRRRGRMGQGKRGGGRMGADKAPKAGAKAPVFELVQLDKKTGKPKLDPSDPEKKKPLKVKLADLTKAKKPVALVFGSYT
ncbi:MAG: hypothetical protein ACYTGX_02985 [Planctomycetota bacterium]|jgi:hypothetical protein